MVFGKVERKEAHLSDTGEAMSDILRCENPRCDYYCKDSYALNKHRAWCQSRNFEPPSKRHCIEVVSGVSRHRTAEISERLTPTGDETVEHVEVMSIPGVQENESDSEPNDLQRFNGEDEVTMKVNRRVIKSTVMKGG